MRYTVANHRLGLSRVAIIVVIVIGLLVLGAFVTGIRVWRDTAARAQCQFNLDKISVGIFEFSKAQNHLPASCIEKQYATWAVQIAPYLPKPGDQGLAKWDLKLRYYDQPEAVRQVQVYFYYCPARRSPPQVSSAGDVPSDEPDAREFPGALGDYACSAGDGSAEAPWDTAAANGAIILGKVRQRKGQRIERWTGRTFLDAEKSLVRGLSSTILIGEKHVPLDHWGRTADGDGSLYNGDYYGSFARVGGPGFGLAQSLTDPYNRNFGSYHSGICHFLFADGHVQPYATSISESVLGQMTNRFRE